MTVYGFRSKHTAQLAASIARQQPPNTAASPPGVTNVRSFIVKAPTGGIPAISGDTPGTAECEAYILDPAGDDLKAEVGGPSAGWKVINVGGEVAEDSYVLGVQLGNVVVVGSGAGFDCDDLCDCEGSYMKPEGCAGEIICCRDGTPYPCGVDIDATNHIQNLVINGRDGYPTVNQNGASFTLGFPYCSWQVPVDDPTYTQAAVVYNPDIGRWELTYRDGSATTTANEGRCSGSFVSAFVFGNGIDSVSFDVANTSDCQAPASEFVLSHPDWFQGCGCLPDVDAVLSRWTPGSVTGEQIERVADTIHNKNRAVSRAAIVRELTKAYA